MKLQAQNQQAAMAQAPVRKLASRTIAAFARERVAIYLAIQTLTKQHAPSLQPVSEVAISYEMELAQRTTRRDLNEAAAKRCRGQAMPRPYAEKAPNKACSTTA